MQEKQQIEKVIASLKNVARIMKKNRLGVDALCDIEITARELNVILFHVEKLNFQKEYELETEEGYTGYVEELELLITIWQRSFASRSKNMVDAEFWEIYDFFKYVDKEVIYGMVVSHYLNLSQAKRDIVKSLHLEYPFLRNKIDFENKDFSLIWEHVENVSNQIEGFRWLYEQLGDYRSKAILNGIIRYWFEFDEKKLKALNETLYYDYYDLDILGCGKDGVMVDLGAFVGEAVHNYIKTYPGYEKIYAYEITPSTFEKLEQSIAEYDNVFPMQKGVSATVGKMYVCGHDFSASNKLTEDAMDGDSAVEVVTLDDDLSEVIGLIKMDIEGAEKDALRGAKRHIREEKPQLAISAYHYPGDMVAIAELIHSMRDDYRFYLRYNGKDAAWPCDYVLFAV